MRPGIGVGVFILNETKDMFLMSQRKDCGKYGLPGGHLEKFEGINQCGQRECLEETGLNIDLTNFREYPKTYNVIREEEDFHYLNLYTVAQMPDSQEFKNTEPQKHSDWEWAGSETFTNLYYKNQLFSPLEDLFRDFGCDFDSMMNSIKQLIS